MTEPLHSSEAPSTAATWPPRRFYWAEIDAMGWHGSGPLPPGLLLALAEELPLPVEDLQAVGIPVEGDRVLICACPRENLAGLDPAILELRPASVPDGLSSAADLASLNLLIGDCEPPAARAKRRSWHAHLALTLLACSLLLTVGLFRRALAATADALASAKAADTLLTDAGTPQREDTLIEKAKLMRAIAEVTRKAKPAADASAGLQELLRVWPTQLAAKPQNLSVNADGISMSVTVDGDPAPFLASFVTPAGFALDEPRIATAGPVTRLSLHLRPAARGAK
jgi:hypothetical protein